MRTRIAEHLTEQLRSPVDDAWLTVESRRGCDEAADLDNTRDAVDADQRMHGGQRVERARARQRLAVLRGDLRADLAGLRQLSALQRQLACGVDEVARA